MVIPLPVGVYGEGIYRFAPTSSVTPYTASHHPFAGGTQQNPTHLGSTLSLAMYGLVAQLLEHGWFLSLRFSQPCYRPLVSFDPKVRLHVSRFYPSDVGLPQQGHDERIGAQQLS